MLKAQSNTAPDNQNFRLINADKLFLTKVNNENILELFGRVHFFYGETEFRGNRALLFDQRKITSLIGNVRVQNDTIDVFADSVAYYRTIDKLHLGGNVIITEKEPEGLFNQFAADFGTYDKANDVITATGNVKAQSNKEKARARCDDAYWDRKNGYGHLLGKPELWSEDKDTLYIRSERMEFFDKDRKVIATFDVLAQSGDFDATSDFLLYFLKEEKAIFQGEPKFTSAFSDAVAEEFYLYFKDRKLVSAELKDSCLIYFAEEKGKLKTNWVRARFVRMNLNDDYLNDFTAEEDVLYFYEQQKEDKNDFFSNSASGKFLSAKFKEDGKLESMYMKEGIKGTYRFENN